MSHINTTKYNLVNSLLKKVESKAGIIIEEKYITDFLSKKFGIIFENNDFLSLEPSDYDSIFKALLSDIGYDDKNVVLFSSFLKKYINTPLQDIAYKISADFVFYLNNEIDFVDKKIDFEDFITCESEVFGINGLIISLKTVENFINYYSSDVFSDARITNWKDKIKITDLYNSKGSENDSNEFFDQRYIRYLYNHFDSIDNINWRQFEKLTAQYFKSEGYDVNLQKGIKDGGVDIVLQKKKEKILVQCKRHKSNIGVGIIKEIGYELIKKESDYTSAIIVSTHDLTIDSKKEIEKEKLLIEVANRETIMRWIKTMIKD